MPKHTNQLHNQNKEKEKQAAELVVANKKLLFQSKEKEKRAAELVLANKELLFQNKESTAITCTLPTDRHSLRLQLAQESSQDGFGKRKNGDAHPFLGAPSPLCGLLLLFFYLHFCLLVAVNAP